tara:strand:- start:455 stop:616 length:162 start_codon:yes stop_codon:yes gene_type:complete
MKYKAVWIRQEVFNVLDQECKYQGVTKGGFTERLIKEGVKKNIYNDPLRLKEK